MNKKNEELIGAISEGDNDDECDCYECYIDMMLMMDGQDAVYKHAKK